MKKLDAKLIRLYKEINRRENLKIHLVHLEQMIEAKAEEMDIMRVSLEKEEKDVATYENLTLYSLFSKVLGTHEKQLEIERQEYLHALMLYRGLEENYANLVGERQLILKSMKSLHSLEREFEKLLEEKDQLIKNEPDYPEELNTLNQRIASFAEQIKEINITISKGQAAKKCLLKLIFNLNQLEQWGFQGRYPGSSSMLRKNKQVKKQIYGANNYLQEYEDHLFTISTHNDLNFKHQIKNLEAFLDRFVDDLITDWVVNKKIQNSAHLVTSMMDTITKLNSSLEYEKAKIHAYLDEDEELKGDLIVELIQKK
ncbi:MAG: hypothetical protein AAGA77_06390 [Bacteroidota bacterium]